MNDARTGRWVSHIAERDGVRWHVEVDASLRARVPLPHLPTLTRVSVAVSGDGAAPLAAGEAAMLDAAVAAFRETASRPRTGLRKLFGKPNEVVYVGRRSRPGQCELAFHSARRVSTLEMGELVRHLPGGHADVEECPDPEWAFYLDALHPGPRAGR